MNKTELMEMIDLYFDGELEKSKEPILFTHLSQDEECRDYFAKLNKIKSTVEETVEVFPAELEERILHSVGSMGEKPSHTFFNKNLFAVVSYSFAVVLIFLTAIFYSMSNDYKNKFETTTQQVNQQNKMINLLLNGLPQSEVRSGIENEIIVHAKL